LSRGHSRELHAALLHQSIEGGRGDARPPRGLAHVAVAGGEQLGQPGSLERLQPQLPLRAQPHAPGSRRHLGVPAQRARQIQGLDGRYYFHLRAANGEIVLQSQPYTAKASAQSGIASVRSNGASAGRFELRDAADGQTYFVLKAANGQMIAVGETYVSSANAERGVSDVVSLLSSGSAIQQ
jgi:uncharacterized protein YegP (UPF0339 family)